MKEGGKGKLTEAELHKERLLRYDKELAQRTTVLDDQADYFEAGSAEWLTGEERAEGLGREEDRRRDMHERKRITLNLAF